MDETRDSLTNQAAYALSGLVALSYVGVLYIIPSARSRPWQSDQNGRRLDRLHPTILKVRLYAICYSVLLSILLVALLVKTLHSLSIYETIDETLVLTGLKPPSVRTLSVEHLRLTIQPVILIAILFWGPIYGIIFLEESKLFRVSSWKDAIDIYVLRAIIIGPLFEEVVFRGCIIAFHLLVSPLDRLSKTQLIFISPLWFGLAHVHGIWETYITLGRTEQALIRATIQTVVQFVYTTIFGWFATFIHLRTSSVIAAVLCHSFCNFMGLPPIFELMKRFPHKRSMIIIHHLIGMIAFSYLVRRWASDPTLFPNSILWMSLNNHSLK